MKHTVTYDDILPALEQFVLLAVSNNAASMRSKSLKFKPSESRYYVQLQDLRTGKIEEKHFHNRYNAIDAYNNFDEEEIHHDRSQRNGRKARNAC